MEYLLQAYTMKKNKKNKLLFHVSNASTYCVRDPSDKCLNISRMLYIEFVYQCFCRYDIVGFTRHVLLFQECYDYYVFTCTINNYC